MKKILLLTDFSHKSEHAAEIALKIAERTASKLIFYNAFQIPEIVPPITSGANAYQEYQDIQLTNSARLNDFAEKVSNKLYTERPYAKPAISCISEEGFLAENVSAFLKSKSNIWFIIMGDKSDEKGFFDRIFNESETKDLINGSTRPILLVPQKAKFLGFGYIALATTLEKADYKALKVLLDLAKYFSSRITLVHVCKERLSLEQKLKNIDLLNKIKSKLHYPDITYEDVTGEELSATLSKFASAEKADILSIIHRKHHLLEKLLRNSTTEEMLLYHKMPLMVFPMSFG